MAKYPELSLFVFVDALGWEIFSKHRFLEDYWALADRQETVLGYSCTCDPTILTGCMPAEHGHFSFFYQSDDSPFQSLWPLRWLPSGLVDRGRVRRWLSRMVAARQGYDGYFQLYETPFEYLSHFSYSEKRDIYQPGGILGGQPTIFDTLRQRNIPFCLSDWRRSETHNVQQLHAAIDQRNVPFAYLYLAGLDGILHADGLSSSRAADHLRWYESQLRAVIHRAETNYESVRLFLLSDHGMTNVVETIDLMTPLKNLPLEFGVDYVAYLDSTMARFWFRNSRAEATIKRWLQQCKQGRLLSDEELQSYGVFFADGRYGDAIFLCDPGVLIAPSFMGKKPLRGMHGYDPQHLDSWATFATNVTDRSAPERLDGMFAIMQAEVERISLTGANDLVEAAQ